VRRPRRAVVWAGGGIVALLMGAGIAGTGGGDPVTSPTTPGPTTSSPTTTTTLVRAVTPKTPASKPAVRRPTTRKSTTRRTATTTAARTDPRFGSCKAARAAGYGPYHRGLDPEYRWYHDRDHDGVVCES
jgi:Excalibur calcium-binding domain